MSMATTGSCPLHQRHLRILNTARCTSLAAANTARLAPKDGRVASTCLHCPHWTTTISSSSPSSSSSSSSSSFFSRSFSTSSSAASHTSSIFLRERSAIAEILQQVRKEQAQGSSTPAVDPRTALAKVPFQGPATALLSALQRELRPAEAFRVWDELAEALNASMENRVFSSVEDKVALLEWCRQVHVVWKSDSYHAGAALSDLSLPFLDHDRFMEPLLGNLRMIQAPLRKELVTQFCSSCLELALKAPAEVFDLLFRGVAMNSHISWDTLIHVAAAVHGTESATRRTAQALRAALVETLRQRQRQYPQPRRETAMLLVGNVLPFLPLRTREDLHFHNFLLNASAMRNIVRLGSVAAHRFWYSNLARGSQFSGLRLETVRFLLRQVQNSTRHLEKRTPEQQFAGSGNKKVNLRRFTTQTFRNSSTEKDVRRVVDMLVTASPEALDRSWSRSSSDCLVLASASVWPIFEVDLLLLPGDTPAHEIPTSAPSRYLDEEPNVFEG